MLHFYKKYTLYFYFLKNKIEMWFFLKDTIFNSKNSYCVSSGTFGSKCSSNNDCTYPGLICSLIGYYTQVCLHTHGEKCLSNYDCANLLFCNKDGFCSCEVWN